MVMRLAGSAGRWAQQGWCNGLATAVHTLQCDALEQPHTMRCVGARVAARCMPCCYSAAQQWEDACAGRRSKALTGNKDLLQQLLAVVRHLEVGGHRVVDLEDALRTRRHTRGVA